MGSDTPRPFLYFQGFLGRNFSLELKDFFGSAMGMVGGQPTPTSQLEGGRVRVRCNAPPTKPSRTALAASCIVDKDTKYKVLGNSRNPGHYFGEDWFTVEWCSKRDSIHTLRFSAENCLKAKHCGAPPATDPTTPYPIPPPSGPATTSPTPPP